MRQIFIYLLSSLFQSSLADQAWDCVQCQNVPSNVQFEILTKAEKARRLQGPKAPTPKPSSAAKVSGNAVVAAQPVRGTKPGSPMQRNRVVAVLGGEAADHEGQDYPAPRGTKIFSFGPGKVCRRNFSGDFGNVVEIAHGNVNYQNSTLQGMSTRYAHLSQFNVRPNTIISDANTTIGRVGSSGQSTGPHLHFEVRYQNSLGPTPQGCYRDLTLNPGRGFVCDPLSFMGKQMVFTSNPGAITCP